METELRPKRNKILFVNKVNNLRNSFADCELTMDDITAEMELVRQKRYETGKQVRANNH